MAHVLSLGAFHYGNLFPSLASLPHVLIPLSEKMMRERCEEETPDILSTKPLILGMQICFSTDNNCLLHMADTDEITDNFTFSYFKKMNDLNFLSLWSTY